MGVERETVLAPFASGSCVVTRVSRGASGNWSAEFNINFRIIVDDDREVIVQKIVGVTASQQRGRKRRAPPTPGDV